MRINRYLARAGVASRRKAEDLILAGNVLMNGKLVCNLATNVNPTDSVEVNGKIIELPKYVYLALNKPAGYTCTRADKHAQKTIYELLPEDQSLISVGRLDRDTTGLILITNDGVFAQNIIHPSKKIAKKYLLTLSRNVTEKQIKNLTNGVVLDDGPAKALEALIINNHTVKLTIEEGRNRIVRRMAEAVDNKVVGLKRIQIGAIKLDIKAGEYRSLTPEEISPYV